MTRFSQASATGRHTLLIQLPIPQLNFGRQTGNIPLAAGCLKMAADRTGSAAVRILPQPAATYLGDAALLNRVLAEKPDIVGFSVYAWNVDRSLYLAGRLKSAYGPRIVFGGPEVTPDNPRMRSPDVDFYVYGDGEAVFAALLEDSARWVDGGGSTSADSCFEQALNPYLSGLLEPEIENMLLVETQRGCPYRCGYCFYGKARERLTRVPASRVVDAVRWAREQGIAEVYLLDPCLNSRQDLHDLLARIARINSDRQVRLISEIRAEAVDDRLADGLAQAGFTWFEIGLQSTTPAALRIMNRPTDLKAFTAGTRRLRDRGIRMGVDLIAGLPGDDPDGFLRSVAFVLENGLAGDVQVFPLSVLPGTPFRKNGAALGLVFEPHPPYTVVESPGFSRQAIAASLDHAQERFDLSLYPFPDVDLSGCSTRFLNSVTSTTCQASVSGESVIIKVLINHGLEPTDLDAIAVRLAHPYQLVFGPRVVDDALICRVLRQSTAANPFTPVEVVWVEPPAPPDVQRILESARLRRPHYLDMDLAFLYPEPGNRTVLFTLLSKSDRLTFQGPMQRQVRWWTHAALPSPADLEALEDFDGIFIPDTICMDSIRSWQDALAPRCHDLPAVTFADPAVQKRWVRLTMAEDYWLDLLP